MFRYKAQKTKEKRLKTPEKVSKKRQALAVQIGILEQKERELGVKFLREPLNREEARTQMTFVQNELFKLRRALKKLNTRQRSWATHGFL
jgi:hypothetical protein